MSGTLGTSILIHLLSALDGAAIAGALPLGATVGHRGLSSGGPLSARLVYAGNMLGAGASLIGAVALVYASLVSL